MRYFSITAFIAGFENILFVFILLLLLILSAQTVSAKIQITTSSDLLSENQISYSRTQAIIDDLREKTGLNSIEIDESGILGYDISEAPIGGSEKMRQLILGAIDDNNNTFQISNSPKSKTVHFSKTDQGTLDLEMGMVFYDIRFDFSDFENAKKYSSKESLESFSLGIMIFHEIDHKVSYDPDDPIPEKGFRPDKSKKNVRGVIENTNIVRNELGLILRDKKSAFGKKYRGKLRSLKNTIQIRFFDSFGKRKFLRWKLEKKRAGKQSMLSKFHFIN